MSRNSFFDGNAGDQIVIDTSVAEAAASAAAAALSETNAASSKTGAGTSETNAEASKTAAAASQSSATASATSATASASAASSSATSAASSATDATSNGATQVALATTQATNAATSATTAATDGAAQVTLATAQVTLATAAKASAETAETNAETAETGAENSAATATTKATTATYQAGSAGSSALASATSATASETAKTASETAKTASETAKTASETAKTASETAKTASETAKTGAETAETNAETAETNALSSKNAAASSAGAAAGSASSASGSASSATTAQSAAESARDSALAAFDSFDDRYLGQKASEPTLDNDGDALSAGTLYFNTTTDDMWVYEGSSWVAAYASLSGALLATDNLSDLNSASTARTNLGVDASGTVNYTHPVNHAISVITGLQTTLDAKVDDSQVLTDVPASAVFTDTTYSVGDGGLTTKDFTTALNTKLGGVESGADVTDTTNVVASLTAGTNVAIAADGTVSSTDTDTVYTHPTGAGDKHVPTGGSTGQLLTNTASGTGTWQNAPVSLPTQTSHSGKYLGTDGSAASWSVVESGMAYTEASAAPAGPTNGDLWLDTDDEILYQYQTGAWIQVSDDGSIQGLGNLTTKGDLEVFGTTQGRLPVGTNDQVLTADSTAATGVAWATMDALPSQTGHTGKYLGTDGSAATWNTLDTDANSTTKGLYEHANTISANYSITSGNNAMTAGPITINTGVSVTIPTGSIWVIA